MSHRAPGSLHGLDTPSTGSSLGRGRVVRVERQKQAGRLLLLAVVTGGALLLAPSPGCEVRLPITRVLEWQARDRLPLLIAATTFCCLTVAGMVSLVILKNMRSLRDKWTHQVQTGIWVHLFVSLTGIMVYSSMYLAEKQLVVDTFNGGGHLILRNFHWAMSNPLQWYIFSLSFTMARRRDMALIYAATLTMHVFGFLMLSMPTRRSFLLCFWASCTAFGAMFWQVLRLPLLPAASGVARRICWTQLLLWSGYPLATYLRYAGLISEWAEQVLLYTFLDFATKCVSFSSVIISRFALTLANINATMEYVLAAKDLALVLDDEYRLLDCLHGGPSVQGYFDLTSRQPSTLLDCCISGEHRERIRSAAMTADMQPAGVPSPKCTVAFALRNGGGEVLAECVVSKCVQGRRGVGVKVTSVTSRHPLRAQSVSQAPSVRSELLPATLASR